MSFTGGEWRVAGTTQSRYIDARQPDGMVQEVAWCGQCEYGDNIDNARLLCAAPDLLEALEDLKREIILSDVDMDYIDSHFKKWLDKARTAIDKARGQQ